MRRWLHPTELHAWRWRALAVWIAVFTAIVAWTLNDHTDQTNRAERLAMETKAQNKRQQAVLVALCNRGYIELGLIEAAIDATRVQLRADLKDRPKVAVADVQFIRQFQSYHAELIDQLTSKDSPCVTISTR